MDVREVFEKLHPAPSGVRWSEAAKMYVWICGNHHGLKCETYQARWEGFLSGHNVFAR